jgi:hypothetical protein
LQRNCAECHGREKLSKGDVKILDYSLLLDDPRRLVVPGHPEQSRLLELIDLGTMPPGRHAKVPAAEQKLLMEWIAGGAPPFCGDDYVLEVILADVSQLPLADRARVRYLSLNHLLAAVEPSAAVGRRKATLQEFLRAWAPDHQDHLATLDETGSVFRIDLRDFGWDERPFKVVTKMDKEGNPVLGNSSQINSFDLVLLDYPYGVIARDSETFSRLMELYFEKARLVRPIPYVRADWFLSRASEAPLAERLAGHNKLQHALALAKLPKQECKDALSPDVGPDTVFAELGLPRPTVDLQVRLRGDEWKQRGLGPLSSGGRVTRAVWDIAFPELVRQLELGQAILPLDSRSFMYRPPGLAKDLIDIKLKAVYHPGEKLEFPVTNQTGGELDVEIYHTDAKGEVQWTEYNHWKATDPVTKKFPVALNATFEDTLGTETLTVLISTSDFPRGEWLRADGLPDLFVHPFYELQRKGQSYELVFDPSRMVKKSLSFEIQKNLK